MGVSELKQGKADLFSGWIDQAKLPEVRSVKSAISAEETSSATFRMRRNQEVWQNAGPRSARVAVSARCAPGSKGNHRIDGFNAEIEF